MIIIEIFIFLSTILPFFHLINALWSRRIKLPQARCANKAFSVLVPCFNEENVVGISLDGLMAMDYSNFEAIYINDGSTDRTLQTLKELLDLAETAKTDGLPANVNAVYRSQKYGHIRVIDKQNGGKSDALNTGILLADNDLVVTLDADSVLKKDALGYMNRAFEDTAVAAAGGAIHILQGYDQSYAKEGCQKGLGMIVALQILEYIKGFYVYKMSLSRQKAMAIISGAFGVFKKEILVSAGGFRKSLGEDIDITMRIQRIIHKTGQKILYLPEALCYTQCPENWHDLSRQRLRWQKGFIDCAVYQFRYLLRTFLYRSVSFHFFVEALLVGICSCLFTVFTYSFVIATAFIDIRLTRTFLIYFAFCMIFNLAYTVSAIAISLKYNRYPRQAMRKIGLAIVLDLLFYRYFGLFMYLKGTAAYFWNKNGHYNWDKGARQKELYLALELRR